MISLLWSLFYLIRHGLSHQYQQIITNLNEEKQFYVKLTGPTFDYYFNKSRSLCNNHLAYSVDSDGDLELTVFLISYILISKMHYMIQEF